MKQTLSSLCSSALGAAVACLLSDVWFSVGCWGSDPEDAIAIFELPPLPCPEALPLPPLLPRCPRPPRPPPRPPRPPRLESGRPLKSRCSVASSKVAEVSAIANRYSSHCVPGTARLFGIELVIRNVKLSEIFGTEC